MKKGRRETCGLFALMAAEIFIPTECLINPAQGRGEIGISGPVLLCITPGEAQALGRYARVQGWQRHFLYNSNRWSPPGTGGAICGPAVGAPMAVLTLEKLIALGGRRVVVFGSCGALAPDLAVGDILLPTWAESQEGTSCHYPLSIPPQAASGLHGELTDFLQGCGLQVENGGVWSTDAPYREQRHMIRHYQAKGVSAVDMEFSALIQVAAFRQVELAAVMVVSDLLGGDEWQPGFTSQAFKSAMYAVGRALFEFCVKDGHE